MENLKRREGRPLKFESEKQLQRSIDLYFNNTPIEEWMITGLACHLDTSRKVLCEYDEREAFSNTIKRAKSKIEMAYEKRGLKVGNAFDIFRLKNMGWKDQQHTDITTNEKDITPEAGSTLLNEALNILKNGKCGAVQEVEPAEHTHI